MKQFQIRLYILVYEIEKEEFVMGISANSKSLAVSHLVAIYKLQKSGKLPKAPAFDEIFDKVLPKVVHKIHRANQILLLQDRSAALM